MSCWANIHTSHDFTPNQGLRPSLVSYTAAMGACAAGDQWPGLRRAKFSGICFGNPEIRKDRTHIFCRAIWLLAGSRRVQNTPTGCGTISRQFWRFQKFGVLCFSMISQPMPSFLVEATFCTFEEHALARVMLGSFVTFWHMESSTLCRLLTVC